MEARGEVEEEAAESSRADAWTANMRSVNFVRGWTTKSTSPRWWSQERTPSRSPRRTLLTMVKPTKSEDMASRRRPALALRSNPELDLAVRADMVCF